jgi:tetratricopeptide (TPR) repeat protein
MHRWVWATRPLAWILSFAAGFGAGPSLVLAQEQANDTSRFAAIAESDPAVVPILRQAEALLADNKPGDAYTFLTSHELDLAGQPMFDYLLGLAALDSGRANDAAFALERVVAAQPAFSGARMELARAQFEQGEFALSRAQFEYLLTQSPPENTRAVIQKYLTAINGRSRLAGSRWSAVAQVGAGYDSNANGSTSEQNFLGFTLDPRNVETSSSFGEALLGIGNTVATGPQSGLVSNLQVTHRANTDASFIDQTVVAGSSTFVWGQGATRFNAGVDGYQGWLDGENHERGVNLNLGASRRFADYEGAISLRGGRLDYAQSNLEILDADRYLAGFALTRLNIGANSGRVGAALLVGKDEARQAGSPYSNDRYGAKVFASWLIQSQSSVYVELSDMVSDYDGQFFGSSRKDKLLAATVSMDFQNFPSAKWSVAPRIRYMKSDSDVSLYEYDRIEAVVYIRRSF